MTGASPQTAGTPAGTGHSRQRGCPRIDALGTAALLTAVLALLATGLFLISRPTTGVASTPGSASHVFQLSGCSIEQVEATPATPPASDAPIYAYADDLYETYTALCPGGY
jgi:hypothetical protein